MEEETPMAFSDDTAALPFLVTQWVQKYSQQQPDAEESRKLRHAAAQMASAFAALGAFGTRCAANTGEIQPRHFADVKRQWAASCSAQRLEHVLQAATRQSLQPPKTEALPPSNLMLAIHEKKRTTGGRTLTDSDMNVTPLPRVTSLLHPPIYTNPAQEQRMKFSQMMREYLHMKQDYTDLQERVASDRALVARLEQQQRNLLHHPYQATTMSSQDIERVQAQKSREIEANDSRLVELKAQLDVLERQVIQMAQYTREIIHNYQKTPMQNLRQRFQGSLLVRASGGAPMSPRTLFLKRFSYATTINTHLTYPIYCLRFDRTGRYFITGADDYLVKVFKVAAYVPTTARLQTDRCSPRDAILVCTLRGHAGVINDIDVSSDNAFLATASEDGDCRVWGLADGRPIAILRGHVSANMVSWSRLTPYRLVTVATDGFAREWDIRQACLKRYGAFVGSRNEYRLSKKDLFGCQPKSANIEIIDSGEVNSIDSVPLPPLPHRDVSGADLENEVPVPEIPLPPLPDAVGQEIQQQRANNENGEFVANDVIDDGVQLISKLQHGASLDERLSRAPTRASRTAVKVICVDRCPNGKHYATGSDDGICRIWLETDDGLVEIIDKKDNGQSFTATQPTSKPNLLRILKGHLGSITDLHYSNKGDRLLTASQKEGMVRVWSWSKDPACPQHDISEQRDAHVSHIVIKLSDPKGSSRVAERRRTGNRQPSLSCDVAKWLSDDSKIVTSQCELIKQSGTDIVAGSQYIFIWDSATGRCLLGIESAHSMPCQVLLPHPTCPSIICSAGMDGLVKIWNLETGSSHLTHKNVLEFGPVPESNEKGGVVGFLDGDFDHDGEKLVLTDEAGRLTLFDCNLSSAPHPYWTKEQYFANDYYELAYDSNGYCVERGSERPPHIAPRGVRCSHQGVAFSPTVNDLFRSLPGPVPIPERCARHNRETLRNNSIQLTKQKFALSGNLIGDFDGESTFLIDGGSRVLPQAGRLSRSSVNQEMNAQSRSQNLSSNWRWRDYTDILREEDPDDLDAIDADDEDFELDRPSRAYPDGADSEEEDFDDHVFSDDDNDGGEGFDKARRSSRQQGGRRRFDDDDSSDDDLANYVSSNNNPSGPFVRDYNEHFWKLRNARNIERMWLRRVESNSSYLGRKDYAPQVGDEVVYIPRAHYDTLKQYPSACPWDDWPENVAWPVVKCSIIHARYRFPMKRYFSASKGSMKSAVVILTLKVIGIPELTENRRFGWPAPEFAEPSTECVFPVKLFLNSNTDFIVPFELYRHRLLDLEDALQYDGDVALTVNYAADDALPDSDYTPFDAYFQGFSPEESISANPHLSESGYKTLQLRWTDDETVDSLSPWEITVKGRPDAIRPRLSENDQQMIRRALGEIRSMDLDGIFASPVDQERFSDYADMVEVPMDLTVVATRLDAGFYGNILGVVFDVRLIYDNCVKYNGEDDDLSKFAATLVENFERQVLGDELYSYQYNVREKVVELADAQPTFDAGTSHVEEVKAVAPPAGVRRSSRHRRERSQFENAFDTPRTRNRENARRRELEARRRDSHRTLRRDGRQRRTSQQLPSVLESPGARLDHMNIRGRNGSSQRTRHQRAAAPRNSMNESAIALRTSTQRAASATLYQGSLRQTRQTASASAGIETTGSRNTRRSRSASTRSQDLSDTSDEDPGPQHRFSRSGQHRRSAPATHASTPTRPASSSEENMDLARRTRRGGKKARLTFNDSSSEAVDDTKLPARSDESEKLHDSSQHSDSSASQDMSSSSDSESDDVVSPARTTRPLRRAILKRSSHQESEDSDAASEDLPLHRNRRRSVASDQRRKRAPPSQSTQRKNMHNAVQKPQYHESSLSDDDVVESEATDKSVDARLPKRQRRVGRQHNEATGSRNHGTLRWPDISSRKILPVTKRLLSQLRGLDDGNLFDIPVIEQYPEIAAAYTKRIKRPMDFSTIEGDRLPHYQKIAELQEDLLLMFQNCIDFNGSDSEYSGIARMMIETLNDAFTQVCLDEGVRLPPHW